jgi:Domain of unknown function (DUF1707)
MDDRLRASNADRDRAAALLSAHFVAGRLTRDELGRRCRMTAGWSGVTGACWLCTRPGTGTCMRKRCSRC